MSLGRKVSGKPSKGSLTLVTYEEGRSCHPEPRRRNETGEGLTCWWRRSSSPFTASGASGAAITSAIRSPSRIFGTGTEARMRLAIRASVLNRQKANSGRPSRSRPNDPPIPNNPKSDAWNSRSSNSIRLPEPPLPRSPSPRITPAPTVAAGRRASLPR